VPTTHVSGGVDVAELLAGIQKSQGSQRLSTAQMRQVDSAVSSPRLDFYTGKSDRILRHLRLSFHIAVPNAQGAQVNNLRSAEVSLDYTIADLNGAQSIAAPANPQPISRLSPQLQGLNQLVQSLSLGGELGALGGSSGGGSASPRVSRQAQAYQRCVQAAGNDLAKAQRCVRLLK
jgi:hypothetical protein